MSKVKSKTTSVLVEKVKLSEVKPYWRNPRKNDGAVLAVKKSIEEFGYRNPIVVDKKKVIIAGHTRYKALKMLGYEEIDVIVADLSEDMAKKYRIADNKTSELSDWDMEALIPELREISDISDMALFFPDVDLSELLREESGTATTPMVSKAAVERTEKALENVFEERSEEYNEEDKFMKITCPNCMEEIQVTHLDVGNASAKYSKTTGDRIKEK